MKNDLRPFRPPRSHSAFAHPSPHVLDAQGPWDRPGGVSFLNIRHDAQHPFSTNFKTGRGAVGGKRGELQGVDACFFLFLFSHWSAHVLDPRGPEAAAGSNLALFFYREVLVPVYCMSGLVFMPVRIPTHCSCAPCVFQRMMLCARCVSQKIVLCIRCASQGSCNNTQGTKFGGAEIFLPHPPSALTAPRHRPAGPRPRPCALWSFSPFTSRWWRRRRRPPAPFFPELVTRTIRSEGTMAVDGYAGQDKLEPKFHYILLPGPQGNVLVVRSGRRPYSTRTPASCPGPRHRRTCPTLGIPRARTPGSTPNTPAMPPWAPLLRTDHCSRGVPLLGFWMNAKCFLSSIMAAAALSCP